MKKALALFVASIMIFATACSSQDKNSSTEEKTYVTDRSGVEYAIPQKLEKIVSCSPSNTEILTGLGLGDRIIAVDQYSAGIDGVKDTTQKLDMQNLNIEKLIELAPDIIFLNEINYSGESGKYDTLTQSGITVINISSANSISDIKSDIKLIAGITKCDDKGNAFVKEISDAEKTIKDKAAENKETKQKVYFEIGAAPYFYTFGNDTYLNEIIEMCGAENIYGSEKGWLSNTEESILAANPDIIMTSVAFDGYSYKEILDRKGWDNINAVKNNKVYLIDPDACSRASQNIVKGMKEIANAINPGTFE